ncbi:MAG: 50S ribosomal protein L10 [Conexivisphaera sp.]|jgi:large subunit ribosomal protein L10|nr:50S ribosomal protein L10 [Conexivisphaerales archaeon]
MSAAEAVRVHGGRKKELYDNVQRLAREYSVIGVSRLYKVKASLINQVRKQLRGKVVVLGIKNRLALKALKEAGLENVDQLERYLTSQAVLMFTNMNPFELSMVLDRSKIAMPAAAGDVATSNIVVPSGNTGMQPGPILSSFKQFKIPTRIESGSIFVSQDTVVAKAGETISADLASLLSKLGLKPIMRGILLDAAYWRGRLVPGEDLRVNPQEYADQLKVAHADAVALARGIAYPTPEVLPILLLEARADAVALARGAGILTDETTPEILARASAEAETLAAALKSKGF